MTEMEIIFILNYSNFYCIAIITIGQFKRLYNYMTRDEDKLDGIYPFQTPRRIIRNRKGCKDKNFCFEEPNTQEKHNIFTN